MVYFIIKNTLCVIINLYIKKVNGLENVPKKGAFIVAANHASYMDHMILQTIMAKKFNLLLHFLAKIEHFRGVQRFWHKYVGAIPLDREKGGKGALRTAVNFLKKGKIIAIYPEGTRTLTGKLQRAKTGVARLALSAKVPVLPIGLTGTFKILPKGKIIPRFKRATVNIGKPMYFNEYYGKENNKKVLRLVTTKLMKEIARLTGKEYKLDQESVPIG